MTSRHVSRCACAALALLGASAAPRPLAAQIQSPQETGAQIFRIGALEIIRPVARIAPAGAKTASGFLTLANHDSAPDRLVAARAETVAAQIVIEEPVEEDGAVVLRERVEGAPVGPLGAFALRPGGVRLTFKDLKRPLKPGESFPVELSFERAGVLTVKFTVEAPGGPRAASRQIRDGERGPGAAQDPQEAVALDR